MQLPGTIAPLEPAARREGLLVGAAVGAGLAAATATASDAAAVTATLQDGEVAVAPPPPGSRRAATALADALISQLTGGGVDLHRLAGEWLEWQQADGAGIAPPLAEALAHLREFDAPAEQLATGNVAALAAVIPAALAAASPRAMISGSFHVARMLDPDPATAFAAVALVMAASVFLEGSRDFVADVTSWLRENGAPLRLFDAVRQIPKDPRSAPPVPAGNAPDPVDVAIWVLWTVHHRPRGGTVLREMALHGQVSPDVGAVLGALLGARDGMADWPAAWIDGAGEEALLRGKLGRRLGAGI
jgi:hypothetical protein